MRIVIITKRLHINLFYRVKALQDFGHEVKVLVWYKGVSERYDGIEPIVIGYSWLGKFFNKNASNKLFKVLNKLPFVNLTELINFKKLKAELKQGSADAILVRGYSNLTFLWMLICARRYSGDVWLFAQLNKHYGENIRKKLFLFLLKKVLKIRGIITPLQNKLAKTDNYFKYLPFVFPATDFAKTYFKNGAINIVSIGKFMPRKDHLLLLRAVNILKDKYKLSLNIIGEKSDEETLAELKSFIAQNKLERLVKLSYNLSHNEVLEAYRDSDLFVLASFNEPAAFSPLEAMSSKLPVIVSDTCGTKCYIKEGENGYIFESKNLDSLIEKLESVIKDKNKLIEMGDKGFIMVKTIHSAKGFLEKFNKIVNI